MTEKELIGKIRKLRQIRPRKDWVVLTKKEILGEQPSYRELFSVFLRWGAQYKPALATLVVLGVLIGTFVFAKNSLPGDFIFPLKKIAEKTRAIFVSREEKPRVQLEFANKRLEELIRITETNQIKKLAPAIEEYQANVSEAAKNLAKIREPEEARKIVPEIKKLEGNIQNLKSHGIVIGEDREPEDLYEPIAELLIKDLENQTLTDEQLKLFEEAKEDSEVGDFGQALEKILFLSYPQE
ncbi:hypothetical protein KJA15_02925 [Patescibacteria group bacterium]|nr:hypothetical protein [Patescibacteria group bacterium]